LIPLFLFNLYNNFVTTFIHEVPKKKSLFKTVLKRVGSFDDLESSSVSSDGTDMVEEVGVAPKAGSLAAALGMTPQLGQFQIGRQAILLLRFSLRMAQPPEFVFNSYEARWFFRRPGKQLYFVGRYRYCRGGWSRCLKKPVAWPPLLA
jgi:hypothetical protein